ncbi:MAG: carbon-nitrogen hydrolase family protein [Candidatus Thermoplasmatota archaeon]|nr:carbon-nitrogen hydrolase family protein [Candidatus Thermoplasmatota archaeon]
MRLKVAIVQGAPSTCNKEENLKFMESRIRRSEAELIVFPELFLTGYECDDRFSELAEPLEGESMSRITKLAQSKNCYVIFGMPELAGKSVYNSSVLVTCEGLAKSYRKIHLPHFWKFKEKSYFREGKDPVIANTKFGKLGMMICYDLFFPELAKFYALKGANIIICISAAPVQSQRYFEVLTQARALENTVFLVYANLVSREKKLTFWGGSRVINPLGKLIATAGGKPCVLECVLDLAEVKSARKQRPVLRDTKLSFFHA